jgi:hypothetical protein
MERMLICKTLETAIVHAGILKQTSFNVQSTHSLFQTDPEASKIANGCRRVPCVLLQPK